MPKWHVGFQCRVFMATRQQIDLIVPFEINAFERNVGFVGLNKVEREGGEIRSVELIFVDREARWKHWSPNLDSTWTSKRIMAGRESL